MKIYSHRGESKYAPENTLKAFYLADILKVDGIECDIRKTKDDVIVVIHDMTVNRTSDGFGFIKDINYHDLLKYNFGRKNDFEKIITLEEYLDYFSKKNMMLFIEIKEDGYEKDIINIIKRYKNDNITLISFDYHALINIRKITKSIKTGWIVFNYNKGINSKAKEISIDNIICPSIRLTKEKVDEMKKNNFIVTAWSLINIKELDKLKSNGVDNVIYSSGYQAKKYLGDL